VQLQNAKAKFEQQRIRLAAISYDSQAILMDFAKRHNIEFPLLADPDSQVIRGFNVLNAEATGMNKGMAHPGFFYIDPSGFIREKYFEAKYTDRFTANSVIAKLFPELTQEVSQSVEAAHLRLTLSQSDRTAVPGSRLTLMVEAELPSGFHVYSPGVKGYKPIQLVLLPSGGIEAAPAIYPSSKMLYLQAIKEQVPVFEGKFRIVQDVTIPVSKVGAGIRAMLRSAKTVSIAGGLQYQACDATICYPPTSVPVKWELKVEPLDLHRSPNDIRHK
jgi:AhpC/TSA family/Disulphide bond corrector protein DsbC